MRHVDKVLVVLKSDGTIEIINLGLIYSQSANSWELSDMFETVWVVFKTGFLPSRHSILISYTPVWLITETYQTCWDSLGSFQNQIKALRFLILVLYTFSQLIAENFRHAETVLVVFKTGFLPSRHSILIWYTSVWLITATDQTCWHSLGSFQNQIKALRFLILVLYSPNNSL